MPKALILNQSVVGGALIITSPGVPNVFINNRIPAVVGSIVQNHGISPHANAKMAQGSSNVRIGDFARPACREGDLADCSHPGTNGSNDVFIN